jgi:group II intron reverse transcriptase/maturase
MPSVALTTLAHHIDIEWLNEAYRRTRKDGAVGVDEQTAAEYAENLQDNLRSLLDRFKSGSYFAPPVRRVHIPKDDDSSSKRPIRVSTFEDKVLQRSVVMLLEAIYEQEFLDCSYAFRPGRSPHQALDAFWHGAMNMGGGWVLELDIKSYFDTVRPAHLRGFLDQRVRDGVLRRAIDKWLKAGVLEEGMVMHPDTGVPQGGVISPILSNIYLHYVLDRWFEGEVKPRLKGKALLIRFADDAVILFSQEADAQRVMEVLPKRFSNYGLTLHPDKTRIIDFRSPQGRCQPCGTGGAGRGSFDFLGFSLFWERTRKGLWVVRHHTSRSRFSRALKRVARLCRSLRHEKVAEQHERLSAAVRGHYAYYGVTGNGDALKRFLFEVHRIWRKWLDRRSQQAKMTWERFDRLLGRYLLPQPKVVHSVYRRPASP